MPPKLEVTQTDRGWEAVCPACGWKLIQQKHVPTRHTCPTTGETVTYVPPDWKSRPKEERRGTTPARAAQPEKRRRVCKHLGDMTKEFFPPKDGAGDALERGLAAFGITKQRWAAVVAAFVPESKDGKGCGGCEKRQQLVNHVGRSLGIGTKGAEIRSLLGLSEGQTLPVFACAVHGRCVPSKAFATIEGAPHSCHGCEQKEMVELLPAPPGE